MGMLDGSLVKVTAPRVQKERYFDRHHNYSINVLIVCNNNLILRFVSVGEGGSKHDGAVFANTSLHDDLERDDLVGPDEHILADSAYTLTEKARDSIFCSIFNTCVLLCECVFYFYFCNFLEHYA